MQSPIFDPAEQQVLNDADFFKIKARIDLKVNALFHELKQALQVEVATAEHLFPKGLRPGNGRTYRGENYSNFPWRALDFPVHFVREDHFAFRTLLLWGHHFSFHFLLSGRWLHHFLPKLLQALPTLAATGLQVSLQASPWQWEMNSETHLPLQQATVTQIQAIAAEKGFLKLSRHHALTAADSVIDTACKTWQVLQNTLFV